MIIIIFRGHDFENVLLELIPVFVPLLLLVAPVLG